MVSVICLILLPLAVARVTRLVVDDAITLPIRSKVLSTFGEDHWLSYLVHCTWCSAMWVSMALGIPTLLIQHPVWMGVLVVAATAQVAPMVLALADRVESGG